MSEKYEVTHQDREKLRRAMTREDVVHSILWDQDFKKIEEKVNQEIAKEQQTENRGLVVGIVAVVIAIVVVIVISA